MNSQIIFYEVFRQNLFKCLMAENLPQKHIEFFLDDIREIDISKTNNRIVLGSMNDLTFRSKYQIADAGGIEIANIPKLVLDINRIPMSAIEEIYSIYELKKLFKKLNRQHAAMGRVKRRAPHSSGTRLKVKQCTSDKIKGKTRIRSLEYWSNPIKQW